MRIRWRTVVPALFVGIGLLPFVGLLETLQLDGTGQSPGTPSWAMLVVGVFAIFPLALPSVLIQEYVQTQAARRGLRRIKAITVPAQAALAVAFALLTVYGRGWLGALAVLGAAWQCLFTVAVIVRRGTWMLGKAKPRIATFADIVRMSERGQAREALALLNAVVVDPANEYALLATKALCAYRAGAFEQSVELDRQIAHISPDDARVREVAAADARLSAALRDGRAVTAAELSECATAILAPLVPGTHADPEAHANSAAHAHSKALLTLSSGDPESAMREGLAILPDKSIAPADRALVVAMTVIAAVRAGHPDVAEKWNAKLPDWCPLRPAVDRELAARALDSTNADGDSDCVFVD